MAYSINAECKGCGVCLLNCPVDAISGEKKELHSINAERCIECGVCGKLCAQSAVQTPAGELAQRVSKKEWPKPVVSKELCSACEFCLYHCFKDCLALSEPAHQGDIHLFVYVQNEKACVACGVCVDCCPVGALSLVPPVKEDESAAPVAKPEAAA